MSVKLVVAEQAEQRTYECFQPSIFPSICKWAQLEQTGQKSNSSKISQTFTLSVKWCSELICRVYVVSLNLKVIIWTFYKSNKIHI